MASDHFEISSMRRSNPLTSEPPDWRFRLHVTGSAPVMLNYSTVCNGGEEREISQGDTLTVGASTAGRSVSVSSSGGVGALRGLHFTFIPFTGTFSAPDADPPERPRLLPELESFREDLANDERGTLFERSHGNRNPTFARHDRRVPCVQGASTMLSNSKAGALRPPTG